MDVTSKQRKKIIKYILDDRHKKLSKFIKKEDIPLNSIMNGKGEKMVHICCREGATGCLEYLVKSGARVNLVDKSGNLPIHNAIQYCMDNYDRELESDLVSFLLTYSANLLNVQNNSGVSPRSLLDSLEATKPKHESYQGFQNRKPDSSDEDEDKLWRERLQDECDWEYESKLGRYDTDYDDFYGSDGPDSFDAWADRIYSAFSERRRKLYAPPPSRKSKEHSQQQHPHSEESSYSKARKKLKPQTDDSASQINTEKLRKAKKLKKICDKSDRLFKSTDMFGLDDMPYCGMVAAEILDAMLAHSQGEDEMKKTLREELRRWHPDKFKQKMSSRIKTEQTEAVLDEVKRIAQAIISFAK